MSPVREKKRELRRQIVELRRAVLPELRRRLKEARKEKKRRLAEARAECKRLKKINREKSKIARARLAAAIAAAKKKARRVCQVPDTVNRESIAAIDRILNDLNDRRAQLAQLRRDYRGFAPSCAARRAGLRSAELRAECDDRVRNDLEGKPELQGLWEQIKHKIKPSRRMTRTEAFFQYLHDHGNILDEYRHKKEREYERELAEEFEKRAEQSAEATIAELENEVNRLRAQLARFKGSAEVPF